MNNLFKTLKVRRMRGFPSSRFVAYLAAVEVQHGVPTIITDGDRRRNREAIRSISVHSWTIQARR